jgi:hypothetical protein
VRHFGKLATVFLATLAVFLLLVLPAFHNQPTALRSLLAALAFFAAIAAVMLFAIATSQNSGFGGRPTSRNRDAAGVLALTCAIRC